MRNSGLVAIGHLFGNKPEDEYNLALAQFCELAGCYLESSLMNKNVDILSDMPAQVNLESSCDFLNDALKMPDADTLQFQLSIERIVWDHIKHRHEANVCRYNFNMVSAFRLFAIFNRFCHVDVLPLKIEAMSIRFVFYKLGLAHPNSCGLTFPEFLLEVLSRRDHFVSIKIIELYDTFVRDIIIEESLLVRFNRKSNPTSVETYKRISQAEFRRVSITTKYLMLKEKETNVDQITVLEPVRDYKERFPISNAKFSRGKKSSTVLTNIVTRSDKSITIFLDDIAIELIVDSKSGPELLNSLVDASKTVLYASYHDLDRLSMLKRKYKIPNSSGQTFSDIEDNRQSEASSRSASSEDSLNAMISPGIFSSRKQKKSKKRFFRRSRSSDDFEKLQNQGKQLSFRTVSKVVERSRFFSFASMDHKSLRYKHED